MKLSVIFEDTINGCEVTVDGGANFGLMLTATMPADSTYAEAFGIVGLALERSNAVGAGWGPHPFLPHIEGLFDMGNR